MSAALGASLGGSDGCTFPAGISFLKNPGRYPCGGLFDDA